MHMEINKIGKSGLNKVRSKQDVSSEKISFTEIMGRRRDELHTDKLQKLVQDIEDQGKILANSCTIEDLLKYKQLVKDFMEDAVKNGLNMKQSRGFNRGGRAKIYKIIVKVDEKLLDLTDAVLNKQQKGLRILELTGEIQGLLINIFA